MSILQGDFYKSIFVELDKKSVILKFSQILRSNNGYTQEKKDYMSPLDWSNSVSFTKKLINVKIIILLYLVLLL